MNRKYYSDRIALEEEYWVLQALQSTNLVPKVKRVNEWSLDIEDLEGVSIVEKLKEFSLNSNKQDEAVNFIRGLVKHIDKIQQVVQENLNTQLSFHIDPFERIIVTKENQVKFMRFKGAHPGTLIENYIALGTLINRYLGGTEWWRKTGSVIFAEDIGISQKKLVLQISHKEKELQHREKQRKLLAEITAVLMCGGKSSRMGYVKKQNLMFGQFTFLEHIYHQLGEFSEVALSCNEEVAGKMVWKDIYPERGPIGGIHSALSKTTKEIVFFTACDMPNISRDCIAYLAEQLQEEDDCLVAVSEGKQHPMCAFYKKRIFPVVEEQIHREDYRLINLLKRINSHYVEIPEIYKKNFLNINNPETLENQREEWKKNNEFSFLTNIHKYKKGE